ncbi:MAG: diaminopimelate epimerase [Rhodospirillaceae bacterium]|nr:diaminopimelate epimerase [Rhodospirillaceae bacterium]
MRHDFIKMHGAGNDFVVLDLRDGSAPPNAREAVAIADRHRGIGCDQIVLIGTSATGVADFGLTFLNSDGSESGACGNGTRCAADLVMRESGTDHLALETAAGILDCSRGRDGRITVDMGLARTEWRDIPLAEAVDTLHLGIGEGPVSDPVAVSMGNPHAVFFVPDAAAVPIDKIGPKLERHPLFPQRANIGFAEVKSPAHIRLRVWERGAGLTLACGSGACAALVAAVRRGLVQRKANLELDGGSLDIEWLDNGHVLMTGPTAIAFRGTLDPALFDGLPGAGA